jgi:hypothetical protein
MPEQLSDTSPDAMRVLVGLLREAPAWRKAQMVDEMTLAVRQLVMSGLRSRHPDATEEQLRRRLADLLLGPELALRAYGPADEL